MKMECLIAFTALLLGIFPAAAQQPASETIPKNTQSVVPEYAYCEIIGSHIPAPFNNSVMIDFGQETSAWTFNKLQNVEGQKYSFNSMVETLNFMVRQGWEFVQAYSSGEETVTPTTC